MSLTVDPEAVRAAEDDAIASASVEQTFAPSSEDVAATDEGTEDEKR
jgi:hypothetical protein